MFVYEDDSKLPLDYPMLQKFGRLQISPPVDVKDLDETQESLKKLRDCLKVKGQAEVFELKAKLLKDETWL